MAWSGVGFLCLVIEFRRNFITKGSAIRANFPIAPARRFCGFFILFRGMNGYDGEADYRDDTTKAFSLFLV